MASIRLSLALACRYMRSLRLLCTAGGNQARLDARIEFEILERLAKGGWKLVVNINSMSTVHYPGDIMLIFTNPKMTLCHGLSRAGIVSLELTNVSAQWHPLCLSLDTPRTCSDRSWRLH